MRETVIREAHDQGGRHAARCRMGGPASGKGRRKEEGSNLRDRQLPQEDPNGLSLPGFPLKTEPEIRTCVERIYLGGDPRIQE